MFKDFSTFQCHIPNGVASMYFGGITYSFEGNYPNGTVSQIKHFLLTTFGEDVINTVPFTLTDAIAQAKQYSMKLIVMMNEVIREDISLVSPELFGRVAGIIADILVENGFTDETAAIILINEPKERWKMTESQYIIYVKVADKYVEGRFPLIVVNEEYHKFNEALIIPELKDILQIIWGVHHLGSLGQSPAWQNIRDAKTQANEWKIPIGCDEGGSWWADYQSPEGHAINIKLIAECKKYDYKICAICLPELNEQGRKVYKPLGYRVWNNNYTKMLYSKNWKSFQDELKKYWKGDEPMPEDRDLKLIPGYMHGEDVKKVQTKLREIGFDLKIDSWYGTITEAAIKKFQELTGLTKNGIVDKNVREMFEASSPETFYPEVFQNIYTTKGYSIEAIDYYLNEFAHSDLKGHGKYFVQAEQESGIPAEWQLANGAAESSYKGGGIGSSPIAQKYNNLYGWGIPDSGVKPEANFASFAECILYVQKEIKRLFLDKTNWRYHGDHIFGIEVRYSTAVYNAVNKSVHYRKICDFLDAGIKIRVPEYMDALLEKLDERYVKK